MKVVYKSVLEKIKYEIEQHVEDEDNQISYFLLTKEEFDEFCSEVEVQENVARQFGYKHTHDTIQTIYPHIVNKEKVFQYQCIVYREYGVDWVIVGETK